MGFLLAFMLLLQGIPVQQGGTVTGVLRDSAGMPVAGIRMAAVTRPDSLENVADGTAMAGIAETDTEGKFILENIPPGRYVIAAGRLDLQTYFPGTQAMADATIVTITPGETVSGINFALKETSIGRAESVSTRAFAAIPVKIITEDGGKLPISSAGNFVIIRTETSGAPPVTTPLDASIINVPGPSTPDYRVTVENLPARYMVKSITYGSADITQSTFRLTPSNFTGTAILITGGTVAASPLFPYSAALAQFALTQPGQVTYAAQPPPNFTPPLTLTITLARMTPPSGNGIRVSGRTGKTDRRHIYISGRPGDLFSDGSFEFRGVPPGRHRIATVTNPSTPLAAVVVVGDKDLEGVELKETPLLPKDIRVQTDPLPAGDRSAGSMPLARVRGTVVEEATREPITEGEVAFMAGGYSRSSRIGPDGRFEGFDLLPGTYDVKLQIFGHTMTGRTIVVDDRDVDLELSSRRLY